MKRKNENRPRKRRYTKLTPEELDHYNKRNVGGTSTYFQGGREQVDKCNKCLSTFNENKRINPWMLKCFKVYVTCKDLDDVRKIKKMLKNPKYPHTKIGYLYNRDDRNPLTGVIYNETEKAAIEFMFDFFPDFVRVEIKQGCKNMRVIYPQLDKWGEIKDVYEW